MNRMEGYKQLMHYSWLPMSPDAVVLSNTSNGATGVLNIDVSGWYSVKIAGGGPSASQVKQQNTGTGSSAAGFIGEIFLERGQWDWKCGKKGAADCCQNGEASYLLRHDNHEKGIIANGGIACSWYPDPPKPGGILEQKNIKTRNVLVASQGNTGYIGISHGFEVRQAPSVFKEVTGENWGMAGMANYDNAVQGIVLIKFKGV